MSFSERSLKSKKALKQAIPQASYRHFNWLNDRYKKCCQKQPIYDSIYKDFEKVISDSRETLSEFRNIGFYLIDLLSVKM
ncbi:hypothetical protein [Marinomonas flavescens]|uniref:hypothetical protein n=1 Tax=Marinomonas flavescens TaxID=2529379 RepID=UPI001054764A|nr:hypothetical protein [Marinomonas flavescens]